MPCYIRMKRTFLQGLLWLYLLGFGFMALSLEPGYLDFDNLPDTNFSCVGKVIGGYYADLETNCQMFHVCTIGQLDEPMDIRFLCLNGTVFDQETRVCERIDEVDCSKSEQFYSLNLELYGNTQPATLEESPETEQPLIIKPTTITTTTTTQAPKPQTTRAPFYTTATTPRATTSSPQVISTHHFPVVNSPDIRFNPEEINISLHPGAPPDIRTKPVTFLQHTYSDNNKKVVVTTHSDNSDNKKVAVTTHSTVFDDEKVLPHQEQGFIERPQVQVTSQKPRSGHNYGDSDDSSKNFNHPTSGDINFGFTFHQTESSEDYHTEPQDYHFHSDFRAGQEYSGHHHHHNPHSHQFKGFQDDYTTTTSKGNFHQKTPTTVGNYFLPSLKPPDSNQHHHYTQHRTENPEKLQLPIPLLPTLPPLTFSTPAPFSLHHHIDAKRYTKDHQTPPRIIISASASVSDASGRRLNYSLGTIGAAEILEEPPSSYDEYKEEDVGLDPFYHDVPKLKRSRKKRSAEAKIKHTDIIRNEQEAVDVLKFLIDWYKLNENEKTAASSSTAPTVPISSESVTGYSEKITPITERVAPNGVIEAKNNITQKALDEDDYNFGNSDLFNKNSKYSIIGIITDDLKTEEKGNPNQKVHNVNVKFRNSSSEKGFLDDLFLHDQDYVNDNFEPIAYNEKYGKEQEHREKILVKPLNEESKNVTLPTDYVDDNIEPIYYRDRNGKEESSKAENNKISSGESNKVTVEHKEEPKELDQSGDTETNDINKKFTTEIDVLLTPAYEITTVNTNNTDIKLTTTTDKTVITPNSLKSKNDTRRGRRRFHDSSEKIKDAEYKKVVIERLTERAHTAKDDFNYLRTLYKVYSTTPMYNISEEASPYVKIQKTTGSHEKSKDPYSLYVDIPAEVSAESKEDESFTEIQNIPIATTQQTVSTTSSSTKNNRRRGGNQRNRGSKRKTQKIKSTVSPPSSTSPTSPTSTTTPTTPTSTSPTSTTSLKSTTSLTSPTKSTTPQSIDETKEKDTNLETTTSASYATNNSTVDIEKQNRANSSTEKDIETEVNTTIADTVSDPEPTVSPSLEVTDIVTAATTIADNSESRTTFLSELTQRYKKLFEVLINAGAVNPRPSSASDFKIVRYLGAPRSASTEALEKVKVNGGEHSGTTETLKEKRGGANNVLFLGTTPSSSDGRIGLEGLFSSTKLPSTVQLKEKGGESRAFVEKKQNGPSSEKAPSTQKENHSTTVSPIPSTLSPGKDEYIKQNSSPSSDTTTTTRIAQMSTTEENHSKPKTASTIPTALSELYKEVNIELFNNTKFLLQSIQNDSSTEIPSIENSRILAETTTPKIQHEYSTPTGFYIQEIITARNYEYTETPSTESIPTTQLTTETIAQEEERGEDEEETTKTEPTTTVETLPEQHVVQENIHYHNSFIQRFIITEDSKDLEVLSETEMETGNTTSHTTEEETERLPTTELTAENVSPTTGTDTNTEVHKPKQYLIVEILPTTQLTSENTGTTENYDNLGVATEETVPTTQLTTERVQQIIKEVEATTKSVHVPTETPLITKTKTEEVESTIEATLSNDEDLEKLTEKLSITTEIVEALQELVDEIQQMTKSKMDAATVSEIAPKEGTVSQIPSTVELTTLLPTSHYEENATTTQTSVVAEHTTQTDDSRLAAKASTVKEPTTTQRPTTNTQKKTNTFKESTETITTTEETAATTTEVITTTEEPSTTATSRRIAKQRKPIRRDPRPSRRRIISNFQRGTTRHRFSTETFTKRPEGRNQTIEEEILDEIVKTSQETSTEPLRPIRTRSRTRMRIGAVRGRFTDAPLQKSVIPTQPERMKESLPTTPVSKTGTTRKWFIFNCFGKKVDKFYPDPRDCRLFHYCTQGYSKNQLLDMKFVCDFNTYFDDEKLICTKRKPRRCL